jgi:hypothetical protein
VRVRMLVAGRSVGIARIVHARPEIGVVEFSSW